MLKSSEELGEVLTINEADKKDFFIKGVNEISVSTIEEILNVIQKGETNRHYASTFLNHVSSRSHTIFKLSVQSVSNSYIKSERKKQKT